ncbi:hypothetical protein MLD38_034255 [Melastoma candidum]|uniref:Uncharacterized protein n=1 Tax=Melastoma candidum TaxID=119954 RepID=A0ACB9MDL0_9MYRT|nr:hypothetical protein MLD38_034255 [Melastoma candidum]
MGERVRHAVAIIRTKRRRSLEVAGMEVSGDGIQEWCGDRDINGMHCVRNWKTPMACEDGPSPGSQIREQAEENDSCRKGPLVMKLAPRRSSTQNCLQMPSEL